ncbi:MAG: HEPN domain-containing protein [Candidatus Hydrogenedentes bacterium]|nr:HEPN domain-containing protein [Candidatus Hydrogenedentota bacterium]
MNSDRLLSQAIHHWWSMAEESLNSARRELQAKALHSAVNRIYYAAFYATSAALLQKRQSFKKHSGGRVAFHREFIRAGVLDVSWGKFYDKLFQVRQEGD